MKHEKHEKHAEIKHEETKSEETQVKTEGKKKNPWMYSTIAVVVLLAIVVALSFTGTTVSNKISSQEAANKTISFINDNLLSAGTTAEFVSVEEEQDLYKVEIEISGQTYDTYATKDGRMLFTSGISMTGTTGTTTTTTAPQVVKTEKPEANLFVMSFCPYGVQAETSFKPVVDLLGNKTNIKVRFIVSVQGDTIDSVSSLHGPTEAKEDARQVCIMKYYDQKTYWNYLMEFNTNCYPNAGNATKLDACWKQAAQKFGINATKIEACAYGAEGLSLLKADEQLADQYRVTGSPTLIINGQVYSGARTPDAFKQGICSAFTTVPSECSQTLSTSGGTASGGCE